MSSVVLIVLSLGLGLRLIFALVLLWHELFEVSFVLESELYTGGMLILITLAYLVARHPDAAKFERPALSTFVVLYASLCLLLALASALRAVSGVLTADKTITDLGTAIGILSFIPLCIWAGCMIAQIFAPEHPPPPPSISRQSPNPIQSTLIRLNLLMCLAIILGIGVSTLGDDSTISIKNPPPAAVLDVPPIHEGEKLPAAMEHPEIYAPETTSLDESKKLAAPSKDERNSVEKVPKRKKTLPASLEWLEWQKKWTALRSELHAQLTKLRDSEPMRDCLRSYSPHQRIEVKIVFVSRGVAMSVPDTMYNTMLHLCMKRCLEDWQFPVPEDFSFSSYEIPYTFGL